MYSGHLDNQGKGFRQTTLRENKKKINLNECTDVLHILLYQIPVKQIIAHWSIFSCLLHVTFQNDLT